MRARRQQLMYPFFLLIPSLLVYLVFQVYPTLSGLFYAFSDWTMYHSDIRFNGLENYKLLFASNTINFGNILKNTVYFAIMVTVLQNVIGLLLAFLLNQKLWLIKFGRTISFLPVMLSPLIIGVVFTAVLHPNGVFNGMLRAVGLGMFVKEWLGNPDVVMNALVGVNVWQYIGFSMMIFLAGMQSVPQELLECARVEGASSWQVATRITLPLIAPSTTVNIFLSLIGSLKVFDLVMMLTQGGPGTASMVFLVSIYKSLATGLYGLGVAANLVLFVIILAITLVVLPALRRREVEIH